MIASAQELASATAAAGPVAVHPRCPSRRSQFAGTGGGCDLRSEVHVRVSGPSGRWAEAVKSARNLTAVGSGLKTQPLRQPGQLCPRAAGAKLAGTGQSRPRRQGVMPQQAWSNKRERQYDHIKQGLQERGRSEDTAEEIAARTVNKERARSGESRTRSRTSTSDISSSRRGGLRSHSGSGGRTRDQLYAEAQRKNIRGRSKMTKAELERAVGRG
jgi:hypothetical protein